jgi:predicted nucleic acid-binding protein
VAERWIADASPLITLAKIGQARLLEELADELLIPAAVAEEVLAGQRGDPARVLIESGFGRRVSPRALASRVLSWGLGRGETEVLSLAAERAGAKAVIDDAAARRCADALGLP